MFGFSPGKVAWQMELRMPVDEIIAWRDSCQGGIDPNISALKCRLTDYGKHILHKLIFYL